MGAPQNGEILLNCLVLVFSKIFICRLMDVDAPPCCPHSEFMLIKATYMCIVKAKSRNDKYITGFSSKNDKGLPLLDDEQQAKDLPAKVLLFKQVTIV